MPVKVVSRSTTNALNSGSSSSLTGNVMDWMETTIRLEASISLRTSGDYTVVINTDGTLLLYGGVWADLGFEIGDTMTLVLNVSDADLLSPAYDFASGTTTIDDIQGDVLTMSAAIPLLTVSVTVPGQDALRVYNYLSLTVDKDFAGLEFTYNQMLNSDVAGPTLNSIIDTTQTVFKLPTLNVATTSYVDMIPTNPKSGNSIDSCKVKGVSKVSGVSTFDVKLVHNIVGFYDESTDISNEVKPDWYDANECPTDTYKAKFYKTFGDENVVTESSLESTVVKKFGNVGWFNENKNGLPNNYTISGVTFQDTLSGDTIVGVQSSGQTTISFTVTDANSGLSSVNSKFNWGIAFAPLNRSDFNNNTAINLQNLTANTMGVNQAYTHSASPVVGTISGYTNLSGARIDVESYHFDVASSSVLNVEIIVNPSSFDTFLDTLTILDRQLGFWISIGNTDPLISTDRVSILYPCLAIDAVVSLYPYAIDEVQYFPYDLDYYAGDLPYTTDLVTRPLICEDDIHINYKFKTEDYQTINSVTFGIDIADSSGNRVYVADSYSQTINSSNAPVDFFGTQQINVINSRQFKYLPSFKDNKISLQRDSSVDTGIERGYDFTSPYRMRWEWWKANAGLISSFFQLSEPNNNLNFEWFTKQIGGAVLRHFIELNITDADGVTTDYRNTYDIEVITYDDDKRYLGVIEVYPDDTYTTSSNIGTFTNNYTGDLYAIIDNQDNFIKTKLLGGADDISNLKYAEVTIEVNDGSGWLSMWKIRTDQTPDSNNPLQPLAGETALKLVVVSGTEINLFCKLDPSLLTDVNFKITAEWVSYRESGEEHNEYWERQIAFAKIIKLTEPGPTEERSNGGCCYELPVLASTTSDDLYKNDILGLIHKRANSSFDIELFLLDSNGNEYALNDNTYGTFFPFGSFTYEPDVVAFQVSWKLILTNLGSGNYRFKRVNTEFGAESIFYSCCYNLQEFSVDVAHKTVRIETVQNGYLEDLDINFKGISWGSHLRFEGFFGYEEPNYEQDFIIDTNNNQQLNHQDLVSEYVLKSYLVPHKCVTKQLYKYFLRGTEIFISDYNIDNHSYDYYSTPVILVNLDAPKYFAQNRNALINVRFKDKILSNRLTTAEGDRPDNYLSPDYVYENQCPVITKDLTIAIQYETADDTSTVTIIANAVGTITSAITTGLTTVAYTVNASPVTIPFALVLSDVLEITYDAAASDGVIILTGTYV